MTVYSLKSKSRSTFLFNLSGLPENQSNVLSAPEVYRSVDIYLINEHEILCEITEDTVTTWEILKLEDDPRTIPSDVPPADLRKTLFQTIQDSPDFSLPGKTLPYGFYEIRTKVQMKGVRGVSGSDSIFIQVVPTPWLEAAVSGGSSHTVPYGFVVSCYFWRVCYV